MLGGLIGLQIFFSMTIQAHRKGDWKISLPARSSFVLAYVIPNIDSDVDVLYKKI